jgi:hypothetical protein
VLNIERPFSGVGRIHLQVPESLTLAVVKHDSAPFTGSVKKDMHLPIGEPILDGAILRTDLLPDVT